MQVNLSSALAPLLSAYFQEDCEPPLTTKTASFAGSLDYIWVRMNISCSKLQNEPCSAMLAGHWPGFGLLS